jgi:hypothetical protein
LAIHINILSPSIYILSYELVHGGWGLVVPGSASPEPVYNKYKNSFSKTRYNYSVCRDHYENVPLSNPSSACH